MKAAAMAAPKYHCRDCAHSYDWQRKANDGHLIFCRCKYDKKSEYGRWVKFLSDIQCDHFQLKLTSNQ